MASIKKESRHEFGHPIQSAIYLSFKINAIIEIATIDDISPLVNLVNDAYRGEPSRKGWTTEADLLEGSLRIDAATMAHQIVQPGVVIYKYLSDQRSILGCVSLEKQKEDIYLGMLSVSPHHQMHGIGKKLLEAADAHAKKNGLSRIRLTVISLRIELIEWYERHGFVKTGEKKPFSVDPIFGRPTRPLEFIVMEKKVNAADRQS
jgi:ribosomal protein S18 acetylase RimI-like enzyme